MENKDVVIELLEKLRDARGTLSVEEQRLMAKKLLETMNQEVQLVKCEMKDASDYIVMLEEQIRNISGMYGLPYAKPSIVVKTELPIEQALKLGLPITF